LILQSKALDVTPPQTNYDSPHLLTGIRIETCRLFCCNAALLHDYPTFFFTVNYFKIDTDIKIANNSPFMAIKPF